MFIIDMNFEVQKDNIMRLLIAKQCPFIANLSKICLKTLCDFTHVLERGVSFLNPPLWPCHMYAHNNKKK